MQKQPQSSVMLLVAILAVVLAAGTIAALTYLQSRPDAPEGTKTVVVEDVSFVIQVDPAKEVVLVDGNPLPVAQPIVNVEQAATEVPQEGQGNQQPEITPTETPVPPTAVPPPPAVDKIIRIDYTVQPGDTLFSINEARSDTTIPMMAQYGIDAADIMPGSVIKLPIANPNYCPAEQQAYVVREGDTAYNVSRRYNTTEQNLQAINGLDANFTIKLADVICVPRQ